MEEQNAKAARTLFGISTPLRSWWARFTHGLVSRAAPVAPDEGHDRLDFDFNAYTLPSSRWRAALRLRAELDELIALCHRDPTQFLEGYRRAARLAGESSSEPERPARPRSAHRIGSGP